MTLNTIVEFSKKNMEFYFSNLCLCFVQIEDNDYVTIFCY